MKKRGRDTTPPPGAGTQGARPGSLTTHFIREAYIQFRGRPRKVEEPVTGPQQAVDFARRVVPNHAREHALVLYLDSQDRPIAYAVAAVGTVDSVEMHPREIFQPAIHAGASKVVLLHNHPSGFPYPSMADYIVTKRLAAAGRLLRIHVHDSIVWAHHSRDYASLREMNPRMFRSPAPLSFEP